MLPHQRLRLSRRFGGTADFEMRFVAGAPAWF